jgi:hypothetical protein
MNEVGTKENYITRDSVIYNVLVTRYVRIVKLQGFDGLDMQERSNTQFDWRTVLKAATLQRPKLIQMDSFHIDLKKTDFDDMDLITLAEHGIRTLF